MKKIEIIWCQLLFEVLERRQIRFQQQELAEKLSVSTSTVHHALKPLRRMGAVNIGGNGGLVVDAEKILMHWANNRRLANDIAARFRVKTTVLETEGLLPAKSILGAYSAVRFWYKEAPADYSSVYVYHLEPDQVIRRFEGMRGKETEVVAMKLAKELPLRQETTTLAHTFVDLWNMGDWMAKEFVKRAKKEFDEILS